MIEVFPIEGVFGLRPGWFYDVATRLISPSFELILLLLVIAVGIMTLRRFEDADLVKKLWNVPVLIVTILFWPTIVMGLKYVIDVFNTFLITDIFQMSWQGPYSVNFSLGEEGEGKTPAGLSIWDPRTWGQTSLNQAAMGLLLFSRNVIYAFFLLFFFFFVALGPFVLAKGILMDEVEGFLEVIKEVTVLLLWQTTYVVMVGFIFASAGRSGLLLDGPDSKQIGLVLVLAVMTFFVPSVTRKFGNHLGSSFFPPGFKWGGALLGATLVSRGLIAAGSVFGLRPSENFMHAFAHRKHQALTVEEFAERYRHSRHIQHLEHEVDHLKHEVGHAHGTHGAQAHEPPDHGGGDHTPHGGAHDIHPDVHAGHSGESHPPHHGKVVHDDHPTHLHHHETHGHEPHEHRAPHVHSDSQHQQHHHQGVEHHSHPHGHGSQSMNWTNKVDQWVQKVTSPTEDAAWAASLRAQKEWEEHRPASDQKRTEKEKVEDV